MKQTEALRILQTGVNVFLTGEPGSGKTHTVNAYIEWLRSHAIEPAITASTGIAATHIHGMTIHSWSGIGIKDALSAVDLDAITSKEHVVKRIKKTSVLIIDEVSMLSANVLSMVDTVCREVRKKPEPFGGLQVVLVGDFFQLPPIAKRGGEPVAFAFQSDVWTKLNPLVCYLGEQHRHEDSKFHNVLASIRAQDVDPSTISTILSRETEGHELDEDIPRLFTHNVDVDRINEEKLGRLSTSSKVFHMEVSGAPPLIEALKRGCLSPERLVLKEGAVVMGTKNNPALGLLNGTLGVVIGFEKGTNFPIIERHDGVTITVSPAEWAVEEGGKARAKVSQIPLRLAWAITIHKSQGMSMDSAAIDLSRAFEYGQGYVALSRVRTLSGLHILGWSEQALLVHPLVAGSDEDQRAQSAVARETFDRLHDSGERDLLEERFIKASGGTIANVVVRKVKNGIKKAPAENTYVLTKSLIQQEKTIQEIVAERKLTFGTICTHIEKLAKERAITLNEIEKILPKEVLQAKETIVKECKKRKGTELTPLYEHFKGLYSFDEIRLARLFYTPIK